MPWVLKTGENCLILTRIEYSRVFLTRELNLRCTIGTRMTSYFNGFFLTNGIFW